MSGEASLNTALEPLLVGLRLILGVITAYTALDQFRRLRPLTGAAFRRALIDACLVLGLCIWVGHFIGLQALSVHDHPGVPFYANTYAIFPGMLALAASMVAAIGALLLTRVRTRGASWLFGGLWLGLGLGVTREMDHFALFVPAVAHLDPWIRYSWFGVTLASAVAAFGFASRFESAPTRDASRRLWPAALGLGAAITAAQAACLSAAVITVSAAGRSTSVTTVSVTDLWAVSIVILALIGMYFYREGLARQQQALADMRTQADAMLKVERLKRDLLGTASHELRTPLAVIIGNAELLEDGVGGDLSSGQRGVLSELQAGASRLERLVDNMLDFVALEAGTFASEKAEGDLRHVVSEVCDEMRPRGDEAGVTLTETSPPDPVMVRMDGRRIAQVLRALLDNAIRFNRPGGRVEVAVESLPDAVKVSVKDTGVGIAKADLPSIFDTFSQLDSGITRSRGGAGLGLAIARGLVQDHGGVLGAESEVGVGSTFWFSLPTRPVGDQATASLEVAAR